jgi:RNA polymerase sigma factor (sigma-70 family)
MPGPTPNPLVDLFRQAQAGSEEAATTLFEHWGVPLLHVIRHRLSHPLRRIFDSDDFLLETFAEALIRKLNEDVFKSPQTLLAYLQKMAVNKVRDAERKYLGTQRYNIGNDVPLDGLGPQPDVPSKEPPPLAKLISKELVEEAFTQVVERLPPFYRNIVQLLLDGRTPKEIAAETGVKQKDVYRLIQRIRQLPWMDGWMI